jgi:hypothetical protein
MGSWRPPNHKYASRRRQPGPTDPGWLRLGRGCQLWKCYYTAPFDEDLANPEDYAQISPFLKFSVYTLQDTFFLFQAGLQERTSVRYQRFCRQLYYLPLGTPSYLIRVLITDWLILIT